MNKFVPLALAATLLITGCASVDMASPEVSEKAKRFETPGEGKAGVYIYRNSLIGKHLKKDLWIDGKCIGESAPNIFFYTQVKGGEKHRIETESEFSPNALELMLEAGKNYFFRQFIKLGAFVGGADLEQVSEEKGKADIADLEMALTGKCSAEH